MSGSPNQELLSPQQAPRSPQSTDWISAHAGCHYTLGGANPELSPGVPMLACQVLVCASQGGVLLAQEVGPTLLWTLLALGGLCPTLSS